jgi:hypothetical protein
MSRQRRSRTARALALFLSFVIISPLWAAPGDLTTVPDTFTEPKAPKGRDIAVEDATVSTQTGDLRYAYPITVPPGRMGMQPSLSLVYSSSAGQYGGIADGWTLPIPTIQLDTSYSYLEQTYMAGLSSTSWQRQRFTSSLSGDRPFVRIDEGASHPDVLATYRAQSDDG